MRHRHEGRRLPRRGGALRSACTPIASDRENCGACGNACQDGASCSEGVCAASCVGGTTACGVACVDLANDPENCGACGEACSFPSASAFCSDGACVLGACDAGRGDCDGDAANGCEANTDTDPSHCGGCGAVCGDEHAMGTCSGGKCTVTCDPGHGDCDADAANGCEVDTSADPKHCGACGSACSGGRPCVLGKCAFQFQTSQVIDGLSVNCKAVNNGDPLFTECSDFRAGGRYFPNGVSCEAAWSMTPSPYTDLPGFCESLTGVAKAEVYYTCGATETRATWKNHTWGTMDDNGFAQHVRCHY